ncbi:MULTISPECIES: phage baseplate protein [Photorhabdus]|uniref:Dit-like phage tail protein N-terminal domain-containing protein n=2 Tax=Photorhabdus TaxID=29487 RepID=A0A7X5TI09_9GAMM|nr:MULTISPECIES: hypothetical protein [Photorhabdus]KER03405.1 hypothetical protein MEG1DRAFT_01880 [Photorhabdus temperata subsp. temperata Meg1]NHB94411.1 hypothetical protein [Photorhabdus cinerea]
MFGMPEIPNWKGIPNAAVDAGISLGGAALINTLFGNYWGIFNQYGIPLLLADNVISLQYQNQYRVVSAPIENGSFASYNKISDPYKVTVQLSKGSGGTLERGAFLSQIEILAKSTLKFHVVTPEFVYTNAAIVGYDMAREAKDGATLIKVNLHLEEIREIKVKYDEEKVKNPEDTKKKDTGNQTQKVESQVQKAPDNRSELQKIKEDGVSKWATDWGAKFFDEGVKMVNQWINGGLQQ